MLGVCHVDVGDDVHDASVGFFGEAFVFASVSGFHVEDGDVETFGSDDAEAGVGVAEHEHGIGPRLGEEFVGAVDDVSAGGSEVVSDGVHIDFGFSEFEVSEEDAVEVVVIVLSCVGEYDVEVLSAFVDDGGESDYLGSCADDDDEFEFAVLLPLYV